MGMYDTINGEHVKCFPWVSYYNEGISYHGGDLKYYNTGDEVPYKKPHYNYGENFVILDSNEFPFGGYDYIIHVVVDGKVKDTFENEIGNINWLINKNVINYHGDFLNINSTDDVNEYIKAQKQFWAKREEIRKYWNELFKESMKYFTGLGLLDKDSDEKKFRIEKIKEIHTLMDEEEEKIRPQENALAKEHSKWFIDTSEIEDLINLGNYISAYYTESMAKRESATKCIEKISELLNKDKTLYNRYVEWQCSDDYVREFKEQKIKEVTNEEIAKLLEISLEQLEEGVKNGTIKCIG